jgi:hypothetical protein
MSTCAESSCAIADAAANTRTTNADSTQCARTNIVAPIRAASGAA